MRKDTRTDRKFRIYLYFALFFLFSAFLLAYCLRSADAQETIETLKQQRYQASLSIMQLLAQKSMLVRQLSEDVLKHAEDMNKIDSEISRLEKNRRGIDAKIQKIGKAKE
ncbi:MAG: hypothetical protein GY774_35565 [Planctomycetes bacterium]|nr:hypothetical protein [Planctomycetota bacterium]